MTVSCVPDTPVAFCASLTKFASVGTSATPITIAIAPPRNFPAIPSAMFFGFTSLNL